MQRGQGDLVVKPAMPISAGDHQFGELLGTHLNAIHFDRRELLQCNLVNSSVDGDELGVGTVDGPAKTLNLLAGKLRIDLRDFVLDRLDGALKLADSVPIAGE